MTTDDDRRGTDRRQQPTPFLNRFFLRGRRRGPRRDVEDPCYVDRPPAIWTAFAAVVIALGAADIWLTHFELTHKCATEGNPIMLQLLLQSGTAWAWLVKASITLLGAWLLLAHHRWTFGAAGLVALTLYYGGLLVLHAYVLGVCRLI